VADCLAVDCGRAPLVPAPAPRSYAGVDLMAHDFDSLLRALLDRLPQLAPDWADRSEADLGMVLLELFAYAGDQLSYLQDRVALEGFLRTATQYESVRRLLRLVDYAMDAGCAAETLVLFEVEGIAPLYLDARFAISTSAADAVVYETVAPAVLRPAISRVALAADAPSSADGKQAVFAADLTGAVAVGDRLLLQQSDTGDPQRDPARAPPGEWVTVAALAFGVTTTLTFEQALTARYSAAGDALAGIAPARLYGNAVRATHGATQSVERAGTGAAAQAIELDFAPITRVANADGSTSAALAVVVDGTAWVEVEDFIDSEAADPHFRVTRDNAGNVTLHFGDDVCGAAPAAGATIVVGYRAGNGLAGQVAAERLLRFDGRLKFPDPSQKIVRVRNPFPATGARDAQSLASARLLGPYQLRTQRRAVVPADFEDALAEGVTLVEGGPRVAPLQSKARMLDTGSWKTVFVSVDLADRRPLAATPGLREAFEALLDARRMSGVDVRVEDARYCPLHVALTVQVAAGHFARDVRSAVEQALVGRLAVRPSFFAPGRFRFGQAVHLSDLYAVVAVIAGVASVAVTRFKRLGDRYPDCEAAGAIAVGPLEVARCDNDPANTALGVLSVRTCGGKQG
jgi:hypothetical protein